MELPYFDVVKFHIIDPMHNLYLGTAKKIFAIWVDKEILTPDKMATIQERIQNMKAPSENLRLPHGIGKNWSNLNAHEWKEWVLVFSLYALRGLIPHEHMKMWQTFVLACEKVTKPLVSKDEATTANLLFMKFGKLVQSTLGRQYVTCNMHLHGHLADCIYNFGSIYAFWLFAFERYNGILGSIPTNRKGIEVQLMKKFLLTDDFLTRMQDMPDACSDVLGPLLTNKQQRSGVIDVFEITAVPVQSIDFCCQYWKYLDHITYPQMQKMSAFNVGQRRYLLQTYQAMYPADEVQLHNIRTVFWKLSHIYIGQQHYGSESYAATDRYSLAMASWVDDRGKIDTEADFRPCIIKYYCVHTLNLDGNNVKHVLAYVEWPCRLESDVDVGLLLPLSAWDAKKNMRRSAASFIPVQRILSKAGCARDKLGGKDCLVVAQIKPKLYI